jgi:hypothetical protein
MAKAKADSTVISKTKKTKPKQKEKEKEKVEVKPVSNDVLLRNANTGVFYRGKRPNKTPNGTNGGVPFWEV